MRITVDLNTGKLEIDTGPAPAKRGKDKKPRKRVKKARTIKKATANIVHKEDLMKG